jgi:hypothetical protein
MVYLTILNLKGYANIKDEDDNHVTYFSQKKNSLSIDKYFLLMIRRTSFV